MTQSQKSRAKLIALAFISCSLAVGLILLALKNNINLFYTPLQIEQGLAPLNQYIRVGGLVQANSVKRQDMQVAFQISDQKAELAIHYTGILPDLFRENQGIVAAGRLISKTKFQAEEVLAKHDENYMPPEVAAALEQS